MIADGDFKALNIPDWDREMLEDAYQAVSKANAWAYLARDDVPGKKTCLHCEGNKACDGETNRHGRCWCRGTCRVCDGKGENEEGFMFSTSPELTEINKHMKYEGHSGASYGCTMRRIEFIAKKGWGAYVAEVESKQGKKPQPAPAPAPKTEFDNFLDMISPSTKDVKPDTTLTPEEKRAKFLALPTDMTLDEQAKALRELKDVPMTYYEMRMRFG